METASLVIKVDSSGAYRATDDLRKLEKAAQRNERAAHAVGKAWGLALGAVSAAAIVGATRALVQQGDAMANMSSRLSLVTKGSEGLARAQKDVFDIAQRTASDLTATADLYTKLAQSSEELAGNQGRLAAITETVSKALVVSGADAASASSVIRQFSQALASGTLRGDEFVSVMEGAPRLAKAIADGLGVTTVALRKMAAEGELSTQRLVAALENQGALVDREFGQMPLTVGRATEKVENALQQLIGKTNEASGATTGLAKAIEQMAVALSDPAVVSGFQSVASWLASTAANAITAAGAIREYFQELTRQSNTSLQNKLNEKETELFAIQRNNSRSLPFLRRDTSGLEAEIAEIEAEMTRRSKAGRGPNGLGTIKVSGMTTAAPAEWLAKLNPSGGGVATATGTASRRPAVASDPSAWKAELESYGLWIQKATDSIRVLGDVQHARERGNEAFEQQHSATDQLIADMEFELSLIGKTNEERAKAIALREAEANGAIPAQVEAVGRLMDKMQQASATEEWKGELKGLFVDLTDGVGKASDAVGDFFDNLQRRAVQALADKAINALFDMLSGKGQTATGGGFWGSLGSAFTSMFGGGRAGGGDVQAGKVYRVGENGTELFAPSQSGRIIPATQGAAQRSLEVQVNLTNKGGEPLEAQHTGTRMDGEKVIVDMVLGAVKGAMAQGKLDGDFARNFGMRRMGVQRG